MLSGLISEDFSVAYKIERKSGQISTIDVAASGGAMRQNVFKSQEGEAYLLPTLPGEYRSVSSLAWIIYNGTKRDVCALQMAGDPQKRLMEFQSDPYLFTSSPKKAIVVGLAIKIICIAIFVLLCGLVYAEGTNVRYLMFVIVNGLFRGFVGPVALASLSLMLVLLVIYGALIKKNQMVNSQTYYRKKNELKQEIERL